MGFQGYHQCVCENGHYYIGEARWAEDENRCDCGAEVAWFNEVDDTNCEGYGVIPRDVFDKHFLLEPEVVEECNLGHSHVTKEAVYRIPTDKEARQLWHYYPDGGAGPCVSLEKREHDISPQQRRVR